MLIMSLEKVYSENTYEDFGKKFGGVRNNREQYTLREANTLLNIDGSLFFTAPIQYLKLLSDRCEQMTGKNIFGCDARRRGGKSNRTVKDLKKIASKNNIKVTKKVDNKIVNLKKNEIIAKLKKINYYNNLSNSYS